VAGTAPWRDRERWKAIPIWKRYLLILPMLALSLIIFLVNVHRLETPPPSTYCVPDATVSPAVSPVAKEVGASGVESAKCYSGATTTVR
jgi:hypothetical protein